MIYDGGMSTRLRRFASLAVLLAACGDDSVSTGGGGGGGSDGNGGGTGGNAPPEPLPALSDAPLTTDERISPSHATVDADITKDLRRPEFLQEFLDDGFGEYEMVAGEPVLPRTLDGSAAPEPGANATMIARFVHLADIQLADDESPSRICNGDVPITPTNSAFRPQDGHQCRVLNAAVRTINKVNEELPIDLVVLGGDNIDNAQQNELDWALSILDGSPEVECDSGADDDPVPGGNNDNKDPFIPEGLAMPLLWVNGNHDILHQGNFPPASKEADYLGDYAATGTRDWTQGGGVVLGEVPADPDRKPLTGVELLTTVEARGDGHGIPASLPAEGRAFYTHDLEGTPIRFVILDTSALSGSADGLLHQSDIDDFLVPSLNDAVDAEKLVVIMSHHASGSLTDGSGFGGVEQADAITTEDFRGVLSSYPNVLMHLAAHSHVHRVTAIESDTGPAYWEVVSSSLADFPHQMRLVEVWDLDNGFFGIRLVAFDYQTEGDPIAEEGRKLGILDVTTGWELDASGVIEDRNTELHVAAPF